MKNKGIYINNGNLNSQNIVIGDNVTINSQDDINVKNKIEQSDNIVHQEFINTVKELIAKGQTQTAISNLLEYLKDKKGELLNQILLISSNFHDLQIKFSLNLIDNEFYKQGIAKINYALIQTIDNYAANIL